MDSKKEDYKEKKNNESSYAQPKPTNKPLTKGKELEETKKSSIILFQD
jgi:hypothetical protein